MAQYFIYQLLGTRSSSAICSGPRELAGLFGELLIRNLGSQKRYSLYLRLAMIATTPNLSLEVPKVGTVSPLSPLCTLSLLNVHQHGGSARNLNLVVGSGRLQHAAYLLVVCDERCALRAVQSLQCRPGTPAHRRRQRLHEDHRHENTRCDRGEGRSRRQRPRARDPRSQASSLSHRHPTVW